MANAVTVHLIRHEKTQANVERRYIGWTDEPILSALRRQMTHEANVVYTSMLLRTQQTAKLYFPNAQLVPHEDFNELHFGDFEMKTYEDLQHNAVYRAWIDDPLNITPPNGESFQLFERRVLQTFLQIIEHAGTYTLVVHGGVIRLLLARFLPQPQTFQQVHANHHTQYSLQWESLAALKEGKRCTSFSEAYLTEKPHT